MWVLKQCMDAWAAQGRPWSIEKLVQEAAECNSATGVLDMDAEALMLDTDMPQRINNELTAAGIRRDSPMWRATSRCLRGRFLRVWRCAMRRRLANLEKMLGRKLERIHMIGGATRNKLLVGLTEQQTGLKVEIGETESSTVGSLAVQLAASEAGGGAVTPAAVREWAKLLCRK